MGVERWLVGVVRCGRRWRGTAAAVAAGLLIAATGCDASFRDPRDIDPAQAEAIERAAQAAPGDRDEPEEPASEGTAGAEGRAEDRAEGFTLLRPADEAERHPLSHLWGPEAFAILDGGNTVAEWSNADELWDEVVDGAASACREAGPPIDEPAFDDPEPLDAAVDPYWNNRSTSGRGTLVSVMCAYVDSERGPVERYEAHLIATDPETLEGRVVASSPSWEFPVDDYDRVAELVVERDAALAEWARGQERVDNDPVSRAEGVGLDAGSDGDGPPDTDADNR